MNENYFGKIVVFPNGEVYANLNEKRIGNLYDENGLNEIIYNEIAFGNSWLKTRDKSECRDCSIRYLCPSLSNYESVFKK